MNFARAWYQRFRTLVHEVAKFGVVGAIGLVITDGGYSILNSGFRVGPITSTTIATIVATIVTYLGNRYWSFQHRERTNVAREGVTFAALNGAGLLIQDAVVGFNAYVLGFEHGSKLEQFIALNVGIAIATLFRFWSYRRFVWSAPAAPTSPAAAAPSPGSPAPPGADGRSSAGPLGYDDWAWERDRTPVRANGHHFREPSRSPDRVDG